MTSSEPTPDPRRERFSQALARFTDHVMGLHTSLRFTMSLVAKAATRAEEVRRRFVIQHGVVVEKGESVTVYSLPAAAASSAQRLDRSAKHTEVGVKLLPRNYLVALFSEFDVLVAQLMRAVYFAQPQSALDSDAAITIADLAAYTTLEEAKEAIYEKRIESLLRENYTKQFKVLGTKFNLTGLSECEAWPAFVEASQRRHLFVHCDGQVSEQYRQSCTGAGIPPDSVPSVGTELRVTRSYAVKARDCVYELGVRLAYAVWRNIVKSDQPFIDNYLFLLTIDLLQSNNNRLATALTDHITSVISSDRKAPDKSRKTALINAAQAYKWSGDDAKCRELLNSQDWSACSPVFSLALAVLRDDFQKAAQVMRSIGAKCEDISEMGYRTWPLFKEFRKSEAYAQAFLDVFNEPPAEIEIATTDSRSDGAPGTSGVETTAPPTELRSAAAGPEADSNGKDVGALVEPNEKVEGHEQGPDRFG